MKVAVTGATGFLGRHVLRELSARAGLSVTACARRTEPPADLPEGMTYISVDISQDEADIYSRLGRPDVLLHLAWSGLPNYTSLHHFETELPQQYRFLASLVKGGLPSLVVSGTCYEYGMASGELVETMRPDPSNSYAYAKNSLRCQLEFLRGDCPFELTWTRLFYMFGTGQSPSSLYTQFQKASERGDKSFAMSKGEQLRDFLPVEQMAAHLVNLTLKRSGQGVVNICSGKPTSVRSLVEGWISSREINMTLDLGKYPYPTHEPLAFWGSALRLHEHCGSKVTGS
jgi:dTDP-6-deoxy-L-talose 4-dehydrogenase (NAD+)